MSVLMLLYMASFVLNGHAEATRHRRQQAQNDIVPLLPGNKTDTSDGDNPQEDIDSDKGRQVPLMPLSILPPDLDHPAGYPDTTTNCGIDYCLLLGIICEDGEVCVVTQNCRNRCMVIGSKIPKSTETAAASLPQDGARTLRPASERMCDPNSVLECMHGEVKNCSGTSFSCLCDEGWSGTFCTDECTLSCGKHGICNFAGNRMFCNCEPLYNGKWCENLIPDPEERQRILAAILSSSLAFVLILAIVIPIIMWKKRVIFIMKLIYVFKEYEDDDGKLFDAYISMTPTSNAEKFVRESLQPMLENWNFKLYIQARDTLAGEAMSEAILSAIEGSRRTIMIVTRDYITNEWNRFEYLIAQHETLKLQQRIIPIILEDIGKDYDNMDKCLKHILSSIKCLKFPEDQPETTTVSSSELSDGIQSPDSNRSANSTTHFYKSERTGSTTSSLSKEQKMFEKKVTKFWKRLMLTMPKKKNKESKSLNIGTMLRKHTSYDVSTSTSVNNSTLKHGSTENNKSFILDFNIKNCVNDIPNNRFEIKILDHYNGEENMKSHGLCNN